MPHAVIQQEHRHGRFDQGGDDPEQDGQVICPVYVRRFHQGIRQSLDSGFAYYGIIYAHGSRQDQGKQGIIQAQAADVQIGRDHDARKKHGKQD